MTLEDLRYFQSYYYSLNERTLRMVGLFPYQEPKNQFLLMIIVNSFFFTGFLFEAYQLYHQDFNLEMIINHLQLSLPAACSFISYNTAIINPETVMKLYNHVEYDIASIEIEQETMMFRKYYNDIRRITCLITFMVYVYYVLLILPAIFTFAAYISGNLNYTQIILPLPTENLIDTKMYYYGMLLYQFLLAFIVTTVIAATYTSYMITIQHACLLLGIVILRIKTPFVEDSSNYGFLRSDAPKVGYYWMTNIVRSYVSAVEFVKLINLLSEKVYLVEVAGAVLMLVLNFLYLSDMYSSEHKNVGEIGKGAIYSGTTIFIIYINCYFGQLLINHNAEVLGELRQIPFYKISTKVQKLLPLVIMRCTKPCVLMVGGMFVSSHEFFTALLQTSLSYAMVCHTMR